MGGADLASSLEPSYRTQYHGSRYVLLAQVDLVASKYMNILSQYGAGSGAGTGCFLRSSFVQDVPNNLSCAPRAKARTSGRVSM